MRRPARMGNPCDKIFPMRERIFLDFAREIRDFSDSFFEKTRPISSQSYYTSTIISTIFEIAESLDEKWKWILFSVVGKDSTHKKKDYG